MGLGSALLYGGPTWTRANVAALCRAFTTTAIPAGASAYTLAASVGL